MQFANGASTVVPQPADYDYTDQQLVYRRGAAAERMGGAYPTTMQGNAGFAKLDFTLSPKQLAFLRLSTSRYTGTNNVFFDPSSPITTYAESGNGTEDVKTESLAASLTSTWTSKLATNLRVQFSRDCEQSYRQLRSALDQDLQPGGRLRALQHPAARHARAQAAHRRYLELRTPAACTGSSAAISFRPGSTTTILPCSAANITSTTSR